MAYVMSIHKGGFKHKPEQYRPVSLTSHIMKVFERVLRLELVKHMEENNLINRTQHGFKAGHSTITQLFEYYDSLLTILEKGDEADVIYMDLAKAFGKVDHDILLVKLFRLGIRGKVFEVDRGIPQEPETTDACARTML